MCIVDGSLKFLAPAGRHVYNARVFPVDFRPSGGIMCIWTRDAQKFLSPAGRHVYSSAPLQERYVHKS